MRTTRLVPGLGLALALVLAGCGDGGGKALEVDAIFEIEGQETFDFGRVEVGTVSSKPITARSRSAAHVEIRDVRITGDNAEWLKLDAKGKTITLRSELPLTFQPLGVGTLNATIEFVTNEPEGENVHALAVTGIGFVPAVTVEPTQMDFRNVVLGSERTLKVQLTNGGDDTAAIRVSSVNSKTPEYFTVTLPAGSSAGTFRMERGASAEIAVTYAPTLAGAHQGSFAITPCDACGRITVYLEGSGVESGLLVDPTQVDFGDVNPGSQVCRDVTFSNIGNLRIQLTRASLVPTSVGQELDAAFALDPMELPASLDEGDAFPVTVCFAPEDTRNHWAKLSYASTDAHNAAGEVMLMGAGGGPDIALAPPAVAFGPVALSAPMERTVTVLNQGYADLTVESVEVVGEGFALVEDPTPATVEVGGRLPLTVRFAPAAPRDYVGQLLVRSNDVDTPEAVAELTGTGVDVPPCAFEVVQPELTFYNVPANEKVTRDFAILNRNASGECLVSAVALTPDTDPEFTLEAEVTENILIPAGGQHEIAVGYQPTDLGRHQGGVKFYISNPDTPEVVVPLVGSSTNYSVFLSPNDFDFGVVKPGCSTREQDVCVYNTSPSAITFQGVTLEESGEDGEFHLVNVPASGTQVASGDRLCFKVSYRAVDVGQDNAALLVKLDISPDPFLVTLTGRGENDAVQTDVFTQLDRPQADILFVIDNSGSMGDEQDAIAANFQSFIDFAVQEGVDYHLAVTDTDCSSADKCGLFYPEEPARAADRIVHPDLPDPEGLFMELIGMLGTSGDYNEKAFQAGFSALQPAMLEGPNAGFIRREAYLAVVFVTDENEQSAKTVDFYLSAFLNIKGFRDRQQFIVGAICGDAPSGCTGPGGRASAAPRIIDLAHQAGGIFESICTENWSETLANIMRVAVGIKSRFYLASQAVPGTISVQLVDSSGTVYDATGTWTYDAAANAIDFSPFHVPEPGDTIEITYEVQCI